MEWFTSLRKKIILYFQSSRLFMVLNEIVILHVYFTAKETVQAKGAKVV